MPTPIGSILLLNPHVLKLVKKDFADLSADMFSRGRLRTLFEQIRDEVMRPSIEENFKAGGRPESWEPLSPVTLGFGAGAGSTDVGLGGGGGGAGYIASAASGLIGGRMPLTKSGQMRRAATAKARFQIRNNEMTYGKWPERRWFGPVHDLRDLAERAQIPHRPFVLIQQPEDANDIQTITFNWVFDNIDKHIRRRYV